MTTTTKKTRELEPGDRVRYARGTARVADAYAFVDDIGTWVVTLQTAARVIRVVRARTHEWELA